MRKVMVASLLASSMLFFSPAHAAVRTVTAAGLTYTTAAINVVQANAGDTITLHSLDPVPHSIHITSTLCGGNTAFTMTTCNTGLTTGINSSKSFTLRTQAPLGTYTFFCDVHSFMTGRLQIT